MKSSRRITYLVPSPYFPPEYWFSLQAVDPAVVYGAAAWPSANRAIYIPFWFPASTVLVDIRVSFTTAAGNYDLGWYDSNLNLLEAKGSTACSNAAHTFTLTKPQYVRGGDIFYAGLVLSSTSDSAFRINPSGIAGTVLNIAFEALGSTALPSTATPTLYPDATYIPLFGFGVR